ncbi:MbeD/MobD family mobilization/exclusion protein [uncultured Acinetobacter sp.]|uniref:MbeD/MobD family mobilization/exclusion protein n=1 Tax=uncultured Acinetobacter sp. TaxID=165433 RepID=UPI00345D9ED8
MTATEKLLLDTLKTLTNDLEHLENERRTTHENMLNSLVQLGIRVKALEGLSEQVTQLSEQNKALTEQLRQLTSLSKR